MTDEAAEMARATFIKVLKTVQKHVDEDNIFRQDVGALNELPVGTETVADVLGRLVDVSAIEGKRSNCAAIQIERAIEAASTAGLVNRDSVQSCLHSAQQTSSIDDESAAAETDAETDNECPLPSGDWIDTARDPHVTRQENEKYLLTAQLRKKDGTYVAASFLFDLGQQLSNEDGKFYVRGYDPSQGRTVQLSVRVWNLIRQPLVVYFLRAPDTARSKWVHKGEVQPLVLAATASPNYGGHSIAASKSVREAASGSVLVISVDGRPVGRYTVT
eukprot:SAG31_NODE_12539_length_934_cov_0.867066_1_plen_273_part_01